MYCFVPSWYSTKRIWQMYDRQFYRTADFSEFDDTVSQMKMFLDEGEAVMLLPLCYAPNLRRFLHRQGIMQMRTISVFDEIQDIEDSDMAVITYRDLPWPEDVEWSYTPFVIAGYQQDRHIANIEFDEDGSLLWINYYTQAGGRDQMAMRCVFDDRGFISSILYFENGRAARRDYFNREGIWQIREDCQDGSIEINPAVQERFDRLHYDSLPELITEKFAKVISGLQPDDIIILAAKEQHDQLVLQQRQGRKVILSFYGERYDLSHTQELRGEMQAVDAVVADTEGTAARLREAAAPDPVPIYDISPFDTRLSLGRSQQVRALKIFFPIDGLQEPIRTRAIRQILEILQNNSNAQLLVVTRSSAAGAVEELTEYMRRLAAAMPGSGLVVEGENGTVSENGEVGGAEESHRQKGQPRIFIRNCMKESDITRELQFTRLIVDVRDDPDQYIQIAGISTGIPQVNYRNTRYIAHQKNGYMIHNIADLQKAIMYYLDGLAHWNEALIYCIQQISYYTGGRIVARWKEMTKDHG